MYMVYYIDYRNLIMTVTFNIYMIYVKNKYNGQLQDEN